MVKSLPVLLSSICNASCAGQVTSLSSGVAAVNVARASAHIMGVYVFMVDALPSYVYGWLKRYRSTIDG